MKKCMLALLVVVGSWAYGQQPKEPEKNVFNCRLYNVDIDRHQITVIRGAFGSGATGRPPEDQPKQEDESPAQYKVNISDDTRIYWEGQPDTLVNLDQLHQLAQKQPPMSMAVILPPKTGQPSEDKPMEARAIILRQRPRQQQ